MKSGKVLFLVLLTMVSLCVVNTYPVRSQEIGIIYIQSDGSVVTSTGTEVPIEKDGNIYTFTDNIESYYIVIQRDNIIVDGAGYNLSGEGEVGIDLESRSNVTIKDMQIAGFFYSIYVWDSSYNTITGNTIVYNGYGVYLIGSSQNIITGNTLTNNQFGIAFDLSSNNVLRNNIMYNTYNLAVYGTEPSHYDNDIDTSNIVNGKKVYYLISERDLVIDPSTFQDLGYLALINCENITVHDMELTKNGQGILLAYTTGSTITQNQLKDNYNGLGLLASSSNFIYGNNVIDNYRGIQLSNASNTNSISANNVSDNKEGIFLFNSFQNSIAGNNITNNDIGIGFKEASSNVIRSNYFVNNAKQAYDTYMSDSNITASMNFWDFSYPSGGNYWSDYTGVDVKSGIGQNQTGSDGLGDTPYIIYGNNKDGYPLMPYGSHPAVSIASPQNKTYTVNSVPLTFTVNEITTWTGYSLDGQENVTITDSITLSNLAEGVHNVTVYTQDIDGQTGTSGTIYFTISQGAEPVQSEAFPTEIVIIVAVVAAVVVALIYFLTRKK